MCRLKWRTLFSAYVHWHSAPWSRYDTDPRDWPVVKGEREDYRRNPIIWVDESPGWVVKAQQGQQ